MLRRAACKKRIGTCVAGYLPWQCSNAHDILPSGPRPRLTAPLAVCRIHEFTTIILSYRYYCTSGVTIIILSVDDQKTPWDIRFYWFYILQLVNRCKKHNKKKNTHTFAFLVVLLQKKKKKILNHSKDDDGSSGNPLRGTCSGGAVCGETLGAYV